MSGVRPGVVAAGVTVSGQGTDRGTLQTDRVKASLFISTPWGHVQKG